MFTSIAIPSLAYNPNRPEWKDICPFGYEEANEYNLTKSLPATEKHWKIKEYNYWVNRKKRFESDLKQCDELQIEDQNACYTKLSAREEKLNMTTVTPMQEWRQKQAQWQQNHQNYMMYDAMKNKNYNYNINGNMQHSIHGNIDHNIHYSNF